MRARWEEDLLVQFEGWINDNQRLVEFNGSLLIACQSFFILGVAFGVAALLALSWTEIVVFGALLASVLVVTLAIIRWRTRRE